MFGHRRRSSCGTAQPPPNTKTATKTSHDDIPLKANVEHAASSFLAKIKKSSRVAVPDSLPLKLPSDVEFTDTQLTAEHLALEENFSRDKTQSLENPTITTDRSADLPEKCEPKCANTDCNDLRQLLADFNAGKLRAFVSSDTLANLKSVREQQERLVMLHFDLYTEQERNGSYFTEAKALGEANLKKLRDGLRELNDSIQLLSIAENESTTKRRTNDNGASGQTFVKT